MSGQVGMTKMLLAVKKREAWFYSIAFHVVLFVVIGVSMTVNHVEPTQQRQSVQRPIQVHFVSSPPVTSSKTNQPPSEAVKSKAPKNTENPMRVDDATEKMDTSAEGALVEFDKGLALATKAVYERSLSLKPTKLETSQKIKDTFKRQPAIRQVSNVKSNEGGQEKNKRVEENSPKSDTFIEREELIVDDPLIIYQQKIAEELKRLINVEKMPKGLHCALRISLSRDGTVLKATPINGNKMLCGEALRAARRVYKMPMPDEAGLYQHLKKLHVTVIT